MTLPQLIQDTPLIHNERTRTWAIDDDLAKFLHENLEPGHITLETGSGLSTLVILGKRVAHHIAVSPVADELEVIRSFCLEHAIDPTPLNPIVARSQDFLPTAKLPSLDLVLIDGDHSFPIPFIDWFYTADKLKVGGWLIVDDTNIATGLLLADFMRADPKWQEVTRHPSGRFAIYKKTQHPIYDGNWENQPFLRDAYPTGRAKLTRMPSRHRRPPGPVERTMTKILPWRLVQKPLRAKIGWPRKD